MKHNNKTNDMVYTMNIHECSSNYNPGYQSGHFFLINGVFWGNNSTYRKIRDEQYMALTEEKIYSMRRILSGFVI